MTVIRKKFGNNVYVYQVVSHKWHYLGKEKPINEWLNKVHCGNAYELLPLMPSESVDCVITSPPYYGLRTYDVETIFGGNPSCEHEWSEESVGRTDYTGFERSRRSLNKTAEVLDGHPRFTTSQPPPVEKKSHFCVKCGAWKGQLGLEPSWQMYVEHLVELFREVKRVLKKTGSLWLNIGDTYASKSINWTEEYANKPQWHPKEPIQRGISGYQPKCLMGIPWRVAFALIDDGWILRNAVIWHKCLGGNVHIYAKSGDKVIRTIVKDLAKLPVEDLYLPTPQGWKRVLKIEKQPKSELLTVHLRNGFRIEVTPEHRFLINGSLIEASKLKKGDRLDHANLLNEVGTPLGTYENGWVVGLWLAEGSYEMKRESVRFSLNVKENDLAGKLKEWSERYAGRYREHNYGNSKAVIVSGEVPFAIIRHYTSRAGSKYKRLSGNAFTENNDFLKGVLDGFLAGDGYYDVKNDRYRFMITTNRNLIEDLRVICNRLGFSMRTRARKVHLKINNKSYSTFEIEIRKRRKGHFNQKDDFEILKIEKTKGYSYEIEVEEPHIFILPDGTLTHNSNHMPSSVKDRLTQTYEYIFHFVKSRKYYYNLDNIREPHKTTFAPFNLRVRDVKRGKGGVSAFGPLKASEEEIKNYVYPEKPNYDSKYKDAQSLQGFARSQSIAIRRALSRIEAKILFPNDPEKQQEYINYIHDHDGHPLGKNPGDFISTNSKFLHADVKTASPGARALRIILSGKLTTQVKQRILDVGAYLKAKLRESGLSMKELAEMTGIKQTTLEHYFRTDFSGQAIPDRETWNLLKPILKLGEYDDYINEEIRSALPQPHPLGKNPGDVLSLATQSYHGAHFAVFPVDLPLRPILASCPPDGIVLDPLAGSGTVGETCELINHGMWDKFRLYVNETAKKQKWSLKWILIDVNPQYCELARKRLAPYVNNLETYF